MNIIVNQKVVNFDQKVNVTKVIKKGDFIPPYGVLLNNEFLPYSQHKHTWLKENDKIDVITAIQGG